MIALIDGDLLVYRVVTGALNDIDWGDGEGPQPILDLPSAIETACRAVEKWTRLAGAKLPTVCFSSRFGHNFRKLVDPTYKPGRPDKPPGYWEIVDAIEARFKWYRVEGLEADDVMGIAGTDARFGPTVIVSLDKDMQTVPATIFNPLKDRRPRRIAPAAADFYWMRQTLTGDLVDGYKGCPKIGPVNADRILNETGGQLGAMWPAVVAAYEKAGLSEAHALVQARLARILRSSDYDRQTKEIKLWHLTTPETLALSDILSAAAPTTAVVRCAGSALITGSVTLPPQSRIIAKPSRPSVQGALTAPPPEGKPAAPSTTLASASVTARAPKRSIKGGSPHSPKPRATRSTTSDTGRPEND